MKALLIAVAMFPLLAHADRVPTPPSVPRAPPPSIPKVTVADQLAGKWIVRLTTSLSSCATSPNRPDETWDVAIANGRITITTSGNQTYKGPTASITYGMFNHVLHTERQPSGTILKVGHMLRDRFSGTMVRGDATGNRADPMCVIQYSVWATRAPVPI